ncbi:hypothetical protein [Natronorubrum halophilum]|uniref:hypothetical protein n=1 Tax=Natronorubrum halophilum TaxID=1702106 RepID=UPI001EE94C79|nr:hypothetical protein [Natronorubrum halophilum]
MSDGNADTDRRTLLKGIGVASGAGIFGFGTVQARTRDESVSSDRVADILRRAESRAALETADVERPDITAAKKVDVTGPKNTTERWISVPVSEDVTFSYNPDENIAEVQQRSDSFVRATARDGDVIVEDVELGDDVTEDAVRTLKSSDEFDEALDNGDVAAVKTADAAANFDRISEVTRVFVPAELEGGDDVMLLAEIGGDGSLDSVYGLPTASEIGTQDDGIDCWIGCLSFGLTCANVCTPCAAAPTAPTCAPCAVCVGVTAAAACARECSIPEFW